METAIKLARQYHHEKGEKDRDMFIARKQSYHGSTLGTLGLGGHLERRAIYESLLTQQVRHVSACNPYRDREGLSDAQYVMKKAHELEEEFRKLGPNKVIAFVVEPVAGAVSYALIISESPLTLRRHLAAFLQYLDIWPPWEPYARGMVH